MDLGLALSRIPIAGYVMLGVFFATCVVQLIFAFQEKEKYRRIEKPFCLLSLSIALAIICPTHPLLYIGAFLGMIGDILVIAKFKGAFLYGSLAFFLGHICYILETLLFVLHADLSIVTWIEIPLYFVTMFFPLYVLVMRKVFQGPKQIGGAVYYSMLFTLLPVFIIATFRGPTSMFFSIIGASFFIFSDVLILYFMVKPRIKRYDFYIMLTYLLAQFLIAAGFIFSILQY